MKKIFWSEKFNAENTTQSGNLKVKGIAIDTGITRNGVMYPKEELLKSADSLKNIPIILDHEAKVSNIVGRTTSASFDGQSIIYTAEIMDERIKEMISDGRITNVSIGAMADVKEENKNLVARNLTFLELSLVCVPGCAGASIMQQDFQSALSEAFNLECDEEMVENDFDNLVIAQENNGGFALFKDGRRLKSVPCVNEPAKPKGRANTSTETFNDCVVERFPDGSVGFYKV